MRADSDLTLSKVNNGSSVQEPMFKQLMASTIIMTVSTMIMKASTMIMTVSTMIMTATLNVALLKIMTVFDKIKLLVIKIVPMLKV